MTYEAQSRTEEYLESVRHSLIYNEEFSPADWYFSPENAGHCWGLLQKTQGGVDHVIGLVPASRETDVSSVLKSLGDEFFRRYRDSRSGVRLTLVAIVEEIDQDAMIRLVGQRLEGRIAVYFVVVDPVSGRIASPQDFKPSQPGAASIGFSQNEPTVKIPVAQPLDERAEQERAKRYFRQRARRSLFESGRGIGFGFSKPTVTLGIIAACVLMFVVEEMAGGSTRSSVLFALGAKFTPAIQAGQWWRLFTYQFLHIGIFHLLVNMYSLNNLGPLIEDVYGRWQMLVIYLLAGATGGLWSALFSPGSVSAGASGALLGLLGATAAWMLTGQTSWNHLWQTVGYPILATLGYGLFLRIDHYAHFGGLVGGFLVATAIGVQYRSSQRSRIVAAVAYVVMLVIFGALLA